MSKKFYPPRFDYVFKRIFGDKKNAGILTAFLTAALGLLTTKPLRCKPPMGPPSSGTGAHTHYVQRGWQRKHIPFAFEHTLQSNVVNPFLTRTAMSMFRTSGRQALSGPGPPINFQVFFRFQDLEFGIVVLFSMALDSKND